MLCPWFPVDAVITPLARSIGLIRESRLIAPTYLEGADGLVVLVLNPDLTAQQVREPVIIG